MIYEYSMSEIYNGKIRPLHQFLIKLDIFGVLSLLLKVLHNIL